MYGKGGVLIRCNLLLFFFVSFVECIPPEGGRKTDDEENCETFYFDLARVVFTDPARSRIYQENQRVAAEAFALFPPATLCCCFVFFFCWVVAYCLAEEEFLHFLPQRYLSRSARVLRQIHTATSKYTICPRVGCSSQKAR